jgi:tetratricopeptide (TPR) repeat protein
MARASRTTNREARALFERAIALDPNYAAAHAGLADAYHQMSQLGWTEFPAEMIGRAEGAALRAVALERDNVEAHQVLGRIYSSLGRPEQSLAEADYVLSLNPSDTKSHATRGDALLWLGRMEESIKAFEVAFWLNSNQRPEVFMGYGMALYSNRRHAEAAGVLERGVAHHPTNVFMYAVLAAAYGQLDRVDDAARAAEFVRRLNPFFDGATFGSGFREPKYHDYLADGLRKAGLG